MSNILCVVFDNFQRLNILNKPYNKNNGKHYVFDNQQSYLAVACFYGPLKAFIGYSSNDAKNDYARQADVHQEKHRLDHAISKIGTAFKL